MRNVSRRERDIVRLRCDITGFPVPTYRWYRHGRPLTSITVTSSSPAAAARLTVRTMPWGSRSCVHVYGPISRCLSVCLSLGLFNSIYLYAPHHNYAISVRSDGQIRWFVYISIRVARFRIFLHASAASALK